MTYGPYKCSDGRKRVIHNGKTKTYARYILELVLGRELKDNEDAHHVDEDYTNDSPDNIALRPFKSHQSEHNKVYYSIKVACVECFKEFTMSPKQHSERVRNIRRGKINGPFCSKVCSGKFGRKVYFRR